MEILRYQSTEPFSPTQILRQLAQEIPRTPNEKWWWHRRTHIDFDFPTNPTAGQKEFVARFTQAQIDGGHYQPQTPSATSDTIIGFHTIPDDPSRSFEDRIEEIPAMALEAAKKYAISSVVRSLRPLNTLKKNYTAVISTNEDLRDLSKRQKERISRIAMARLGVLGIVIDHPEYYGFSTMEGQFFIIDKRDPQAMSKLRDRIGIHSCTSDPEDPIKVFKAVNDYEWASAKEPDYLVEGFGELRKMRHIDKPFNVHGLVSERREKEINKNMGWSMQSESAGVIHSPYVTLPAGYEMENVTGALISTGSGRFNIDKGHMNRDTDLGAASIRPKSDYKRDGKKDPMGVYADAIYVFGRKGGHYVGLTIELNEIAKAFALSPRVRVRETPEGDGYIIDPNGNLSIPRLRLYVHMHDSVEQVTHQLIGQGKMKDVLYMIEYVPHNFNVYSFPTGCGKNITVAITKDSVLRSEGIMNPNSGIMFSILDYIDHGIGLTVNAEPYPGTNIIPKNPFIPLLQVINPQNGGIRLTPEVEMV